LSQLFTIPRAAERNSRDCFFRPLENGASARHPAAILVQAGAGQSVVIKQREAPRAARLLLFFSIFRSPCRLSALWQEKTGQIDFFAHPHQTGT